MVVLAVGWSLAACFSTWNNALRKAPFNEILIRCCLGLSNDAAGLVVVVVVFSSLLTTNSVSSPLFFVMVVDPSLFGSANTALPLDESICFFLARFSSLLADPEIRQNPEKDEYLVG